MTRPAPASVRRSPGVETFGRPPKLPLKNPFTNGPSHPANLETGRTSWARHVAQDEVSNERQSSTLETRRRRRRRQPYQSRGQQPGPARKPRPRDAYRTLMRPSFRVRAAGRPPEGGPSGGGGSDRPLDPTTRAATEAWKATWTVTPIRPQPDRRRYRAPPRHPRPRCRSPGRPAAFGGEFEIKAAMELRRRRSGRASIVRRASSRLPAISRAEAQTSTGTSVSAWPRSPLAGQDRIARQSGCPSAFASRSLRHDPSRRARPGPASSTANAKPEGRAAPASGSERRPPGRSRGRGPSTARAPPPGRRGPRQPEPGPGPAQAERSALKSHDRVGVQVGQRPRGAAGPSRVLRRKLQPDETLAQAAPGPRPEARRRRRRHPRTSIGSVAPPGPGRWKTTRVAPGLSLSIALSSSIASTMRAVSARA